MIVPVLTSGIGTSHSPINGLEISRHPGYHEAGNFAAALVEGYPQEVLRKCRRDPRTLTLRSHAHATGVSVASRLRWMLSSRASRCRFGTPTMAAK